MNVAYILSFCGLVLFREDLVFPSFFYPATGLDFFDLLLRSEERCVVVVFVVRFWRGLTVEGRGSGGV